MDKKGTWNRIADITIFDYELSESLLKYLDIMGYKTQRSDEKNRLELYKFVPQKEWWQK